jgi:two-component system phosphate regulon response regulator OmpR
MLSEQSVAASAAVMPEPIQPHILIVDDDSGIRSLLKDYLTENGLRASLQRERWLCRR